MYLEMYLGGMGASFFKPNSGIFTENPCFARGKTIKLETFFFDESTIKFSDSMSLLVGDYQQILFYRQLYFAQFYFYPGACIIKHF